MTARERAAAFIHCFTYHALSSDDRLNMTAELITEAEQRGYARGNVNNATLMEATLTGRDNAMSTMRPLIEQAREEGRVEMREKCAAFVEEYSSISATEIVGAKIRALPTTSPEKVEK